MTAPDYIVEGYQEEQYDRFINEQISDTIWQPDPDNTPQCLAYELADTVDILGYGGQAGGGKTDLGLGLSCTKFHDTLFARRTFPQLRKVIKRGDKIYPVQFVASFKKEWAFSNYLITLGSMQYLNSWTDYQGQGNDLIVFDEAAEFLEEQVRSLIGWNRSVVPGQHTLALLCFNPPTTPEGEWIVEWFAPWVDPDYPGKQAKPGEIRWFAPHEDGENFIEVENGDIFERNGENIYPHSRTFVSASRHDNPYLGIDYERKLDTLPEPLRSKVKYGDFTIGTKDDDWQVIPTNWVLVPQERWKQGKPDLRLRALGVDVAHGGADKTVIAKLYGTYFEIDSYPGVETPKGKDTAQKVHQVMIDEKGEDVPIAVDSIAYGSSADDSLQDDYDYKTISVNVSLPSKATDKSKKFGFRNLRAEIYWKFREALDPESGEDIALPDDRMLRVELCAARYKIVSGKYVIEEKKEIKKRLGHSPDLADAVVLAWYAANVFSGMVLKPAHESLANYRG